MPQYSTAPICWQTLDVPFQFSAVPRQAGMPLLALLDQHDRSLSAWGGDRILPGVRSRVASISFPHSSSDNLRLDLPTPGVYNSSTHEAGIEIKSHLMVPSLEVNGCLKLFCSM